MKPEIYIVRTDGSRRPATVKERRLLFMRRNSWLWPLIGLVLGFLVSRLLYFVTL